jgi:hypothetical protein
MKTRRRESKRDLSRVIVIGAQARTTGQLGARSPATFPCTVMALPLLANGADCGPVNALQTLGKRFEQDRGLQQVCLVRSDQHMMLTLRAFVIGPVWARSCEFVQTGAAYPPSKLKLN